MTTLTISALLRKPLQIVPTTYLVVGEQAKKAAPLLHPAARDGAQDRLLLRRPWYSRGAGHAADGMHGPVHGGGRVRVAEVLERNVGGLREAGLVPLDHEAGVLKSDKRERVR